ncbi:methylamine utilization protein MauJ [Chengkuizengella axinellae]|uniref:HEPN domain-containing protein n=1 Tax=Chengkuizengella axinellae TaxID=3064388 RepID=A0ABT9J3I2_9BACL|nr:methylamine utilization protein MauJ [Chengkuizengella sp. 2205SS18-9]MDP5276171.1 HEPN domain-containing protein [Chengkuizengella sp. 2205SS18-9]
MERKIWEIDFDVIGPITIEKNISFRQEKGFDHHQFYSNIQLSKSHYGIKATITAYADTIDIAETVAYVYFGRMRDILTLNNEVPIQLHKNEGRYNSPRSFPGRRVLTETNIKTAFKMSRIFESEQSKLLRAIGWYSKGKLSHNTFDQFLAFWNVIEILGKKYHTPINRTKEGVKNQIYQCFIDYFGEITSWDLPERWIDSMYDKRNGIVHGGENTTLEAIKETSKVIPLLDKTSKMLIDKIIDNIYDRSVFI